MHPRTTSATRPRGRLRAFWSLLVLLLAPILDSGTGQAAPAQRYVLLLGEGQAIFFPAITAAGAVPLVDLGGKKISEISVIVMADVPFSAVPPEISSHLRAFVAGGGTLLMTGGRNGFGSGGYQAIADLVPFVIRAPNDFVARPFKPPVALPRGHPAAAEGALTTIGNFNDMNAKPGAIEILQYPGGFVPHVEGGAAHFKSPLIAEERIGKGLVLGIAFDFSEVVPRSPKGFEAVARIFRYLLSRSVLPAAARSGAS